MWPAREKWSGDDAHVFKMGAGGWRFGRRFGYLESIARPADDPGRLDHSGRGIEILDDAPAYRIPKSRKGLQCRMDAIPGHRADDASIDRGRSRLRDAG